MSREPESALGRFFRSWFSSMWRQGAFWGLGVVAAWIIWAMGFGPIPTTILILIVAAGILYITYGAEGEERPPADVARCTFCERSLPEDPSGRCPHCGAIIADSAGSRRGPERSEDQTERDKGEA